MSKVRPIAIYLPQFHPIPENDEAWGKGFTEWTNVTKAEPLFKGHYQPHLPADLGFYDLRLAEVREQQAQLAKEYGIHGFCYYHYWFNGKQILERPVEEILKSGKPAFPFMLCWANENWSRVWEGKEKDIIIEQNYSDEDDLKHIQHLIPFFKDERYIRVDGKPVISIYNSTSLPDAKKTLKTWRREAAKHGLELYICRFESLGFYGSNLVEDGGFDAAIDFQPSGHIFDEFKKSITIERQNNITKRAKHFIYKRIIKRFSQHAFTKYITDLYKRTDYRKFAMFAMNLPFPKYKWYPCVTPMWDNTARKGKDSFMFKNSNPVIYYSWLKSIINKFRPFSKEENFVFINAWNEWAEGNHLEPCRKWGKNYLIATRQALNHGQTQERLVEKPLPV